MNRLILWGVAFGTLATAACGGNGAVQQPVLVEGEVSPIEYPLALWDRNVQGETELMIHVTDMGEVDSALVSHSSGYTQFDSAAVTGARELRFTPGKRGDKRVGMWTRMPVRFAQDTAANGAAAATGND